MATADLNVDNYNISELLAITDLDFDATEADIVYSIERAIRVYKDKDQMKKMITQCMQIDHSWDAVVKAYKNVYESIV
jgi:glycogen synthase